MSCVKWHQKLSHRMNTTIFCHLPHAHSLLKLLYHSPLFILFNVLYSIIFFFFWFVLFSHLFWGFGEPFFVSIVNGFIAPICSILCSMKPFNDLMCVFLLFLAARHRHHHHGRGFSSQISVCVCVCVFDHLWIMVYAKQYQVIVIS